MKVVFKYRIEAVANPTIQVPTGAELLHVGEQMGDIYVWALVNQKQPYETRELAVVGTGWPPADITGRHVGTVQMQDGLVFHVFEAATR